MRRRDIIAGLVVGLAICAMPASAQQTTPWVEGYNSKTRMVSGTVATAGGATRVVAGIEVSMADGWKTYWRSPGDAGGVPPYFDWAGSENLASAKVLYPAPERLKDASGDSIGYKKTVIFPVEIAAKDASKPVVIALTMEFGVCREICVPAEAKLRLVLPAASLAAAAAPLAASLDHVPRKAADRRDGDPAMKRATATLTGEKPVLTFEIAYPGGVDGADLFVEASDGIYLALPKKTRISGAVQSFEVVVDSGVEPDSLKGKTLTLTMVSKAGQAEASWKVE